MKKDAFEQSLANTCTEQKLLKTEMTMKKLLIRNILSKKKQNWKKTKSKVEKGKDDKATTAAKDTQKDVEFKDMLDVKEAFIAEREKEIAGLKAEKLQSSKLLDKYKKILYTMDQEIKILKERK